MFGGNEETLGVIRSEFSIDAGSLSIKNDVSGLWSLRQKNRRNSKVSPNWMPLQVSVCPGDTQREEETAGDRPF